MSTSKVLLLCVAPAVALLLSGVAQAIDTAFETFVPAQSSTVFVPGELGQVIGMPLERDTSLLPPREFPTLWFLSDASSSVEIVPANDESSLLEGESIVPSSTLQKSTNVRRSKVKLHSPTRRHVGQKHAVVSPVCIETQSVGSKMAPAVAAAATEMTATAAMQKPMLQTTPALGAVAPNGNASTPSKGK